MLSKFAEDVDPREKLEAELLEKAIAKAGKTRAFYEKVSATFCEF